MGYILPIQPIQSQQYANRMNMDPYNFAYIGRLQRVKLQSDFLEEFKEQYSIIEERIDERKGEEEADKLSFAPPPNAFQGYIVPNPANLSLAIAQSVGKGISVNAYA